MIGPISSSFGEFSDASVDFSILHCAARFQVAWTPFIETAMTLVNGEETIQ
ncbi:hypothetical protein [Rhodopirellula sp. MGV]|uniref:hypothetical protein n=1 Tax=Rhodopirellula sp. MGV TaxID=2023130 RepID=UPI001304D4BF|nr:hypothetical protein [Rhodopirellula sp. MGV]